MNDIQWNKKKMNDKQAFGSNVNIISWIYYVLSKLWVMVGVSKVKISNTWNRLEKCS